MNHKLSEEEITQIVDGVCGRIEKKLLLNLGRGMWGLIWRGILIGLLLIAAYGAGIHHLFPK